MIGITKVAWSNYPILQTGNNKLFYDFEHYVLIFKKIDSKIFFWEPSFGFNCLPIPDDLHRNDTSIALSNCGGEPIWEMTVDEFVDRNKKVKDSIDAIDRIIIFRS